MMRAATKRAMVARVMVMAMRATGDEEREGGKATVTATRVAGEQTAMATKRSMATKTREVGKEEGHCKGSKSNCNCK